MDKEFGIFFSFLFANASRLNFPTVSVCKPNLNVEEIQCSIYDLILKNDVH